MGRRNLRTKTNAVRARRMTIHQKQALKDARSPKQPRTSGEAYAQMALVMGTTLKRIGIQKTSAIAKSISQEKCSA
jgi:hypothetical protein